MRLRVHEKAMENSPEYYLCERACVIFVFIDLRTKQSCPIKDKYVSGVGTNTSRIVCKRKKICHLCM